MGAPSLKNGYAMFKKLVCQWVNVLYSSPNNVRVIKSRRMRWVGHVASMGGGERRVQCFGGET